MNVLILGGTQFVGRHIVEAMLAAGHSVSVFNRGLTRDELPPRVERLHGDRDKGTAGLQALAGRTWDACIDVSGFTPRQVRPSAELLETKVRRYVFISAVSVYGDPQQGPVTESCPRMPPAGENVSDLSGSGYGACKVACENIIQDVYGPRCTLLRPQIVAGPYDYYDRFTYWVRRTAQPGEMLAPGDGTDHLQVIDAGDFARFTVTLIENDLRGSFNLAGPRLMWAEFLQLLNAQNIVWVPASVIQAAGVTEDELPLYRPNGGAHSSLMHVNNERAVAAGLTLTPLESTVNDTRQWLGNSDLAPALSPEREAELIQLARAGARLSDRKN